MSTGLRDLGMYLKDPDPNEAVFPTVFLHHSIIVRGWLGASVIQILSIPLVNTVLLVSGSCKGYAEVVLFRGTGTLCW